MNNTQAQWYVDGFNQACASQGWDGYSFVKPGGTLVRQFQNIEGTDVPADERTMVRAFLDAMPEELFAEITIRPLLDHSEPGAPIRVKPHAYLATFVRGADSALIALPVAMLQGLPEKMATHVPKFADSFFTHRGVPQEAILDAIGYYDAPAEAAAVG